MKQRGVENVRVFRYKMLNRDAKSLKKWLTSGKTCDILAELRESRSEILENDTESRRTRNRVFHETRFKKDSQFVNEF